MEGAKQPNIAEHSLAILGSLHAAMVNYHLYPETSDIVRESVRRAKQDLDQALSRWESVTFCGLEGKLLINDFCLGERDESRPNTVSFLCDLARWEVRSITFERGQTDEDLRGFLEVFSRGREQGSREELSGLLERNGVGHVKVNEKVYVSMSRDQELPTDRGSGEGALDMLREEVFVRFLVGNLPTLDAPAEEVTQLLSDPQRVNAAFQAVLLGFESSGGGVGVEKARLIRDTVDRMFRLVEALDDEKVRETMSEEMVNILAALEPETLVEVLSEEAPRAMKDAETRREIISSVEGETSSCSPTRSSRSITASWTNGRTWIPRTSRISMPCSTRSWPTCTRNPIPATIRESPGACSAPACSRVSPRSTPRPIKRWKYIP